MKDSYGDMVPLTRLEAHVAEKTLGIKLAPDGNMWAQFEYLEEKATAFANNVYGGGPTTKNDVWKAYTLTIRPTMSYCMPASTLTEKQWDSLFCIINKAALPKAGFVPTFTHDILYGPTLYQGLGTMHPWYEQELTHLQVFVDEVNKGSSCGLRFQITTEDLCRESGCPGNTTDIPMEILKAVSIKWPFILCHPLMMLHPIDDIFKNGLKWRERSSNFKLVRQQLETIASWL